MCRQPRRNSRYRDSWRTRGGSQPSYRQYFDPQKWNIIQFDQRGCGQSTPYADLEENTTMHLVSDIEALRTHFNIETWHVFGGSGDQLSRSSTESLIQNVFVRLSSGIFMCRKSELHWFYQDGASHVSLMHLNRINNTFQKMNNPHSSLLTTVD